MLRTDRIRLVPATLALATSELRERAAFASLLEAEIPANWPPESLADALALFLGMLEEHPEWQGWLGW
jgi:hypothetical protein